MAGFLKELTGEKTSMIYLAFLRIYIGYYFLAAGINKLSGGFLSKPILAGILKGWAEKNPHGWYKDFLIETAIPNADLFSYLVVTGEIAVGGLLIAGLMTRGGAGRDIHEPQFLLRQRLDRPGVVGDQPPLHRLPGCPAVDRRGTGSWRGRVF